MAGALATAVATNTDALRDLNPRASHAEVVVESEYDRFLAFVRTPTQMGREVREAGGDAEYVHGVMASSDELLANMYTHLTDPEARLAITRAQTDAAIDAANIEGVVPSPSWPPRLKSAALRCRHGGRPAWKSRWRLRGGAPRYLRRGRRRTGSDRCEPRPFKRRSARISEQCRTRRPLAISLGFEIAADRVARSPL